MSPAAVEGWAWMQALGWTLLHFLWQGLLVGSVFAGLRWLIPRQNASARYANGLVALALLALLPVATLLVVHARQGAEAAAPVLAVAAPVVQELAVVEAVAAPTPGVIEALLPSVVWAWLAGVLLVMGRSWYQWQRLVRVARRWSTQHAELERAALALAERFGLFRRIRVLVSDRIDTPTLIGWLKPVVLLPAAVALGFPRQQVELILAHELGHLRRYDHLVNLAQVLLETLFFYHPVVHWIGREVRHEREICCDALVLHVTRGDPRQYARTLAALEELRQPPTPSRLVLAASGGVLVERVRRILGVPSAAATASGRTPWLPVAAALTLALGLVAMNRGTRVELQAILPAAPTADWTLGATRPAPVDLDLDAAIVRQRARLMAAMRVGASADTAERPRAAAAPVAPAPLAVAAQAPTATGLADAVPLPPPAAAAAHDAHPALMVGDIATPAPRAEVVAPVPVPPPPVATRMVAPEYPYAVAGHRVERVELGFAIAPNGAVGDITVVAAPTDRAFTRAAENALKQWRFDPASLTAGRKAQYRQVFVFAPDSRPAESGAACVRRTGSLLCRRVDEGAADEDDQRDVTAATSVNATLSAT
jgi:TonB family protein